MAFFNENYREINLAILDLRMPKMTGYQMAKKMHELAPDLPTIIITGTPENASTDGHVDMVLSKPVTKDELLKAVEEFIGAADDSKQKPDGGPPDTQRP